MSHADPQGWETTQHRCRATLRWADGAVEDVEVELEGGREHHSVGGEIAEGVRWWAGSVRPGEVVVDLTDGTEIVLELEGGAAGRAVIEVDEEPAAESIRIRGLGPPPFPVNGSAPR